MKRSGFWMGLLVGTLLTTPLIALFFLGDALAGLPLVPLDMFDAVVRFPGGELYGRLLIFGIERMVDALTALNLDVSSSAKTAEHFMAVAGHLITGALAGGMFFAIMRLAQSWGQPWLGLLLGVLLGMPIALISALVNQTTVASPLVSAAWIVGVYLAWGAAMTWVLETLTTRATLDAEQDAPVEVVSRREFLIRVGTTSAAITVVGAGLSAALNTLRKEIDIPAEDDSTFNTLGPREDIRSAQGGEPPREVITTPAEEGPGVHRTDPRAQAIAAQARERIQHPPNTDDLLEPAPGTRPEYTPLDDHYRIDINSRPPVVDGSTWTLQIDGLVDNPLNLSLRDLRINYDPMHLFVTLACVSNPVGGDLTSTTVWTGVSLRYVLADAGVQSGATHIEITSVDGFHESVSLDLINSDERIMLTYYWDGQPLRPRHGYPLRIYVPDRFGMKQPKWIKRIEVLGREREGFWVLRGWNNDAFIKATSVIDTVATDRLMEDPPLVSIGGMAFAGAHGISKVQIRVDQGMWMDAELRSPLSEIAWVIWRCDWPFEEGEHLFEVRCFDGNGREQIAEDRPPPPSGATGIHNVTVVPQGIGVN